MHYNSQRRPSLLACLGLPLALLVSLQTCTPKGRDEESTVSETAGRSGSGSGDPEKVNAQVQNRGEGKDEWWHSLPRSPWPTLDRVQQSQNWFEVYEVESQTFAIYEPGQFEEVISYLIVGDNRALLFDTGLGIGDMRTLVSELTSLPVAVLNSHTHYDHVGGNHSFDSIYGTETEFTKTNARGREPEDVAEFVGPGWIWKDTPPGFEITTYRSLPFEVADVVHDGQVLDLGGVSLEVLLTPGHAPDSVCLLDRKRRLLFTGDTFYPATLYAHLPGSRWETYVATAQRLASLAPDVDTVLPAHNEPFMSSADLLRMGDAFTTLPTSSMGFVLTDGNREYDFGRFSILVADPPPWGTPAR